MTESIVIFWWGGDIRILSGGQISGRRLEKKEDPVAAIFRMIAGDGAGVRAARIIYHPDTLEAHEAACPRTSRSRLRKIFAGEHPALAAPDTVWSAEPIRRGPNGHATVLYIDEHSSLPRLLEGLAGRGFRVEGVWPLQSLIEAFPTCGAAGRGFLGVVATGSQAFVSSLGTSGDRSVRFYDGPEFAEAAIGEMRTVLARFDEGDPPPGLLMLEDGTQAGAFRDALRNQPLTEVLPAELLAHARFLPPGGPSDFLPRKSFSQWMPRLPLCRAARMRLMGAFAAALLIGAGWHAWSVRQERIRQQRRFAVLQEQRLSVERSAESRRALQDRLDRLDEALRRAQSPIQVHYDFLAAVAKTIPSTIALQTMTIEHGRFAIAGHIYQGAGGPESPLPRFCRALAPAEAPWILSALPPAMANPDFALEGSFRDSDSTERLPAPAGSDSESIGEREVRLAAALGRLPRARTFNEQAPGWSQNWIISTRSVDPFSDLEVRHYGLALDRSKAASWAQLMETIRTFCAEPGLTIDRLELSASPDGSGDFRQAEINLTVRLQP